MYLLHSLEHILVSNINKHLALDSILADCQHGFWSQKSCETQLVQFVHDFISNLDGAVNRGHKRTDFIIIDFAKAFDKVPHMRLTHILEYYGIRGSTHKWINSWLSGRTQQVFLDGQVSHPVPVSGVPQGLVRRGGGGKFEGYFGTGVRPSFLKPTPIIYLVFEKNDLFIYLIEQIFYIFTYSSLVFIYPLCCL